VPGGRRPAILRLNVSALVRVTWTRLLLSTVYAQEPRVHARLLERVASRHLLEAAGRIAWIPLGIHMEVCDALRAEVGDPFYRHYFGATSLAAAKLPLFRPLVDGFAQLFGATPISTIKAAPRVWNAIFRDVGSLRVKALLSESAEATLVGLVPSRNRSPPGFCRSAPPCGLTPGQGSTPGTSA